MGTAWARHGHGMGTAWARHGHGMGTVDAHARAMAGGAPPITRQPHHPCASKAATLCTKGCNPTHQAGITRQPLGLEPPCAAWEEHGLVACGDWAGRSARLDEAARSGLAAAAAVLTLNPDPDPDPNPDPNPNPDPDPGPSPNPHQVARVHKAAISMRDRISKTPPPGATALEVRALKGWAEWRCPAWPGDAAGRFREGRWWEAAGRAEAAEERCHATCRDRTRHRTRLGGATAASGEGRQRRPGAVPRIQEGGGRGTFAHWPRGAVPGRGHMGGACPTPNPR
jgi:hypothetical protein